PPTARIATTATISFCTAPNPRFFMPGRVNTNASHLGEIDAQRHLFPLGRKSYRRGARRDSVRCRWVRPAMSISRPTPSRAIRSKPVRGGPPAPPEGPVEAVFSETGSVEPSPALKSLTPLPGPPPPSPLPLAPWWPLCLPFLPFPLLGLLW